MNRLLSRLGVRVASVGLLLSGVAGGVYLGQDREVREQSVEASLVVQADAAEVDLLKERYAAHAAARAPQRKAEALAAEKAATEAKAAAGRARKLEKAAIAKKTAEKKAAEKKAAEEKAAKLKAAEEAEEAAESASESESDSESSSDSTPASGADDASDGPVPASCAKYSGNKKIGCALVQAAGMSMKQMGCLDDLWDRESGWRTTADNPNSEAYGIPQALPGRKMASEGSDWRTNPRTQIRWGLGYIKSRHGTPCGAWSHSERRGWY